MSVRPAARDRREPVSAILRPIGAVSIVVSCTLFALSTVSVTAPSIAQGAAQNGGPNSPDAAPTQTTDKAAPPADRAADDQRRQNLVSVLFMLLGGVLIVGVALIAATMIWGGKLRRLARVPESPPGRHDELWYLKTPPEPDAQSDAATNTPPPPPPSSTGDSTS